MEVGVTKPSFQRAFQKQCTMRIKEENGVDWKKSEERRCITRKNQEVSLLFYWVQFFFTSLNRR